MTDTKKIQHKLVGYVPYKSGQGKALFVNRYGCDGIVCVACDTVFLGGQNHEKVTEDWIGREIELHKGSKTLADGTKEYYVYDVDIK